MNTGHGHVVKRPDGVRARCGGPAICSECAIEQAQLNASTHDKQSEREVTRTMPNQKDCPECRLITPGHRRCGRCLDALIWDLYMEITALETSLDEARAKLKIANEVPGCSKEDVDKAMLEIKSETDELSQLRTENARLREILSCVGVHTCFEGCEHPLCLMRKENVRLRAEVGSKSQWATEMQVENQRLKADCAAMREALGFYSRLENFGKTVWENPETQDGKCWYEPFDSYEIGEIYGESNTGDFGLLAEEALEPASGSDLMAELKALRDVAEAAERVMQVTSIKGNPERDLHRALAHRAKLKEKK